MLFVVMPAIHPTVLKETLASIAAQGFRSWRCIVLEERFTDEVYAAVAEVADGDNRFAVVPTVESVAESVDSVLRDAAERACVVVTPGQLLAADYVFCMLGRMWSEPGAPQVVSCDVLGPAGIEVALEAGPMTLTKYLARPLPSTAVMMEKDAARGFVGDSADLTYHGEFSRALRLLRSNARWIHIDEPLVVSGVCVERAAWGVGQARAIMHEADSAVWETLAASPADIARRLMREWSRPGFTQSMRTKRRLWLRLASRGYRGSLQDVWHHRMYFSPGSRPVVLAIATLPGSLRRLVSRRAYARIENL
ncbi:MAG: hypothetical protein ACYCXR_03440 [Coriobacteriia bacterium]